ncbi:MAG TPA: type II secretion system protein GspM [Ramlibacter sp.]|nr:type II secretion system protein GspM [Ramlibacter sp.]
MNAQLQALRARFNGLAAREKLMVIAAAVVIALALAWLIAIGPALSTLGTAEQQRRSIDAQLQRMATMRTQAQAMQSQPKQSRDEAMRQLEQSVQQRLGTSGRVMIAGDRVTVTLTGTQADALAQWLAQARTAAHSLPGEAHLTRNASGLWEGNIVLILPRS